MRNLVKSNLLRKDVPDGQLVRVTTIEKDEDGNEYEKVRNAVVLATWQDARHHEDLCVGWLSLSNPVKVGPNMKGSFSNEWWKWGYEGVPQAVGMYHHVMGGDVSPSDEIYLRGRYDGNPDSPVVNIQLGWGSNVMETPFGCIPTE